MTRVRHVSPVVSMIAGGILLAIVSTGCRPPLNAPPPSSIEPVYDTASGQLSQLRYDANHDGRADTFSYMVGTRVVRIELDTDGDTVIDRWEHYGDDGRLARVGFSRRHDGHEDAWSYADAAGEITRIEIATQGDGRVDRTEHYRRTVIVGAEEDSDRDGAIDRWETYESGKLARLAFDTEHAGTPTRTLIYHPDGSVAVESASH